MIGAKLVLLGLAALGVALLREDKKPGAGPRAVAAPGMLETVGPDGARFVQVRPEHRAWLMYELGRSFVGVPAVRADGTEVVELGPGGQNALAWAQSRQSSGRDVAMSTSGAPRLATFAPLARAIVCPPGGEFALLLDGVPG